MVKSQLAVQDGGNYCVKQVLVLPVSTEEEAIVYLLRNPEGKTLRYVTQDYFNRALRKSKRKKS